MHVPNQPGSKKTTILPVTKENVHPPIFQTRQGTPGAPENSQRGLSPARLRHASGDTNKDEDVEKNAGSSPTSIGPWISEGRPLPHPKINKFLEQVTSGGSQELLESARKEATAALPGSNRNHALSILGTQSVFMDVRSPEPYREMLRHLEIRTDQEAVKLLDVLRDVLMTMSEDVKKLPDDPGTKAFKETALKQIEAAIKDTGLAAHDLDPQGKIISLLDKSKFIIPLLPGGIPLLYANLAKPVAYFYQAIIIGINAKTVSGSVGLNRNPGARLSDIGRYALNRNLPWILPLVPFFPGTFVKAASAAMPYNEDLLKTAQQWDGIQSSTGFIVGISAVNVASLFLASNPDLAQNAYKHLMERSKLAQKLRPKEKMNKEEQDHFESIRDDVRNCMDAVGYIATVMNTAAEVFQAEHKMSSSERRLLTRGRHSFNKLGDTVDSFFGAEKVDVAKTVKGVEAKAELRAIGVGYLALNAFIGVTLSLGVLTTKPVLADNIAYTIYILMAFSKKIFVDKMTTPTDLEEFFANNGASGVIAVPPSLANIAGLFGFDKEGLFDVVAAHNDTSQPFPSAMSSQHPGLHPDHGKWQFALLCLYEVAGLLLFNDTIGSPTARLVAKGFTPMGQMVGRGWSTLSNSLNSSRDGEAATGGGTSISGASASPPASPDAPHGQPVSDTKASHEEVTLPRGTEAPTASGLKSRIADYRRRIKTGMYLSEAEGQVIAEDLGVDVVIHSGDYPKERYDAVEMGASGDCLIHCLVGARSFLRDGVARPASHEEIMRLRDLAADRVTDADISVLLAAFEAQEETGTIVDRGVGLDPQAASVPPGTAYSGQRMGAGHVDDRAALLFVDGGHYRLLIQKPEEESATPSKPSPSE